MTNNQLNRERLEKIKSWRETYGAESNVMLPAEEAEELARMALDAMDGEPVVFTDERNLHHIAMGRETSLIWGKQNQEAGDIPLYRHAQPAPVITFYRDGIEAAAKWIDQQREAYDSEHGWSDPDTGTFEFGTDSQRDYSSTLEELAEGIRALHPNAGMQPEPVVPDEREAFEAFMAKRFGNLVDQRRAKNGDHAYMAWDMAVAWIVWQARAAMLQAQSLHAVKTAPALGSLPKTGEVLHTNSPVIPDGYVMVPMRLTAENGAKGALSGEFSETKFVNCPECFGDDECETCDGSGRIEIKVPVSWTTIKEIWIKSVEHFAAAPQENN